MKALRDQPFVSSFRDKEENFLDLISQEYVFQYQNSTLYRRICRFMGLSESSTFSNLFEVPFLPVQYFKIAGRELKVAGDLEYKVLNSSATSGQPSQVSIDKETARRQLMALGSVLGDFIGKERRPFLVCDANFQSGMSSSSLQARAVAMQGFLSFATHREYLLKEDANQFVPNLEKVRAYLSNLQTPVVLCGFTFLLYFSFLKCLEESGVTLALPKGSFVVHIGGWKKLESQKVSRDVLLNLVETRLGIPAHNVIDVYGFTEQMGTLYPECEKGFKHCAGFSELIVRHPLQLSPVSDGQPGIAQFFSLVPHSYPGFSLLTDDIVQVVGRDRCECGRKGTFFKTLGRSKTAEIRGCGDIIAEKVMLKKEIETYDASDAVSKVDFRELKKKMICAGDVLKSLSVDDILGVLISASTEWMSNKWFEPYKTKGLSFIHSVLCSGQIQGMLDFSLRGNRGVLDGFSSLNTDFRRFRALPRGIVGHWIAGNVPTLGFISLLLSLLTKNTNLVKLPKEGSPLLEKMIDSISKTKYISKSGSVISGEMITNAIQLLYIPRNSVDNAKLSELSDCRIAWGGRDAVSAIVSLPKKYDCVDIVFGPKLSLACVGREALSTPAKASRVARNIAIDCSVFNQEACASAHTVFVETGGEVSPEAFSKIGRAHV